MIKKILLGMTLLMGMVSCTEDFTDWGNPQTNSQKEAVAFGNGSVAPVDVINLADVNTEKSGEHCCSHFFQRCLYT